MAQADRTVMVTGGAGFAGSYVVRRLLDAGNRVVVFDPADFRSEAAFVVGSDRAEVELARGSIERWPEVVGAVDRCKPDWILHMGSFMDVGALARSPLLGLEVNVRGTCNVLEAARLSDCERVVVLSSVAALAPIAYEPVDANHPTIAATTGPLGAYGASKLASEAFAFAYLESAGVDIRIIRPSALYGFGMSWFAPNYIKQFVEGAVLGQRVRSASGESVPRDYAHVIDLADLSMAVLEGPDQADRVFYAATGEPLQTGGDVVEIVRRLIPGADIEIADEWLQEDRDEQRIRGRLSIDNAREQLGFVPAYTDLEAGIAEYIERFRAFLSDGGVPTPKPDVSGSPGGGG